MVMPCYKCSRCVFRSPDCVIGKVSHQRPGHRFVLATLLSIEISLHHLNQTLTREGYGEILRRASGGTKSEMQLEIVAVDDASPDDSLQVWRPPSCNFLPSALGGMMQWRQVMRSFQARSPVKFRVVESAQNGGAGVARNLGAAASTGQVSAA